MKTQNIVARSSTATKSIFLAFLLVLVGTSNFAYAAGQSDFYGVWEHSSDLYEIIRFYEINNGTITETLISNDNVYKDKYRIVKWDSWSTGYNIYTLDEKNGKVKFEVRMDAYGDVSIKEAGRDKYELEMKKSSTAELNKAIRAATEAAAAAAKAKAEKAVAALKAKATKGSFTDSRDGKTYKTVKLDKQTWMAENLNYNAGGSKCYDNNESNCKKYGRLYDFETAKKACPPSWHLPSENEWQTFVDLVGGEGKVADNMLKASSGWNDYKGKSGNGLDAVGFSGLPGGYGSSGGSFRSVGNYGYWWSTDDDGGWFMGYDCGYVDECGGDEDIFNNDDKNYLQSVRCVKD